MLLIFTYSLSLVLAGGKPPIKIFKKKGLTGSQFLEGVTFSMGGQFLHKNKLKSEIFNKKSL